jgi:NADH-quinone oxidoreductase subunit A
MDSLLTSYLPILIFLIVAVGLSTVMVGLPFIAAKLRGDKAKISAYECGFEEFGSARSQFDIRFYLVSILFIIFDLEIAFLFPWAIVLEDIGMLGFWSMMAFLLVLTIGFAYEWKKGALEWK